MFSESSGSTSGRTIQPKTIPIPSIVVVIPAFNCERHLGEILGRIPECVRHIVVVDDASTDATMVVAERAAERDVRLIVIRHSTNQGVGGAMVTGFRAALALGGEIVVKLDGDGQMPPEEIAQLVDPIVRGEADYAKGNRFRDFRSLRQMPLLRRMGNMGLSFLAKSATGYWNIFDPTNGFVAIRGEVLAQVPLEKIDRTYYFEISMLSQLYLLGAVVADVPMPARYGQEVSNLSIPRVLRQFPARLIYSLFRRVFLKNFIYDFTMESVQILVGLPLLLAGLIYGGYNWFDHVQRNVPTPTGTVVLSALLIILGFQLLLTALGLDLQSVPREPLKRQPPLVPSVPVRHEGEVRRGPWQEPIAPPPVG